MPEDLSANDLAFGTLGVVVFMIVIENGLAVALSVLLACIFAILRYFPALVP